MWKKRIIERECECEWTGINGKDFDTIKYIDVLFYTMEGVKKRDGCVSYGAIGAVVGGSGIISARNSLNGTIKPGQKRITEEEIKAEIEKCAQEIEQNPQMHKFTPRPYPEY